jgi:tetratricopeptide (TPR) repeat protein
VGGVELLTRSLSRWDDLRVVETPRLLDLARRAKLGDDTGMSQEQVIQLARDAGAGTAGLGSILRTGTGQSSITLRLYDVSTGDLLTTESEESPADSLLPVAFSRLADKVFRIAGAPQGAIVDAEPPTQSIIAYREFIQGVRAAYQWQLDSAEVRFAAAIAADPAFALAWVRRAENTFLNTGPTEAGLALVESYADSALAHSSARPLKERLLIESLAALFHADFPKTRELAKRLIELDSTNADAWRSLGMGHLADRFVVEKADGSLETGYDPTAALRAFRRSVALDSSNRQTLMFVSAILGQASFELPGQPLGRVWLSRSAPTWKVVSQFGAGAYYRMIMVAEDSFRFARLAEINRSLRPSDVARSRELAVSQLRTIVRNWLLVAPDDYSAHLASSNVAEMDGNYDLALAEFNQSLTLGFKTEPLRPDWDRLRLVLRGRNDSAILAIADTLRRTLATDRPYLSELPWYMGQLSAAAVYAGRANEGRTFDAERLAMRDRISPRATSALRTFTEAIAEVQARAWSGTMTAAEVATASERLHALHAALPDSIQARQRISLLTPIGYPAALLGDTARVAKLRAALPAEFRSHYPGLDAIAAAVAGDRRKADQLVTRALADTTFPWPGSRYATGRAALTLGRVDDALRSFHAVDSASFNLNVLDLDWLFAARAIRGRADAYLARGDTVSARREYERFVALWRDAEPPYASERDAAARVLAQLRSQSDRKGVSIPGASRP